MRRAVALIVAIVAASLALVSSPASAETQQFTWFDQGVTHTDRTYAQPTQTSSTPPDWTAPVDYANGRVYTRVQVLEKPSTKAVDIQLCAWRNAFVEETCATNLLRVTRTGVFFHDFGEPDSWWKKGGAWAWTTPFAPVRYMVKDAATGLLLMTGSCGVSCSAPEAVTGHVPIRMEVAAVVVAAGATLDPPAAWGGCPTAWSAACAELAPPPSPDDRPVALVTGNAAGLPTGDQPIRNRLVALGHDVRLVDDDALGSQSTFPDASMVVITSSVAPSKIPAWMASLPVPILNSEGYAQTTLQTATSGADQSSLTTLRIVDPGHPLAAGRSGDVAVQSSQAMAIATPVPAAVVVARVPGASTASIYGIEHGAALTSSTAPARRVGFFFSYGSPTVLTAAGWDLFDAAVGWLASGTISAPPTTTSSTTVPDTTTTSTTLPDTTTTTTSTTTTTAPPSGGGRAALVVGDASTVLVGDLPLRNRLADLGWAVTLVDDDALSSAAALGDAGLVVISSSVVPSKMPSWLASLALPILNGEVYIQGTLRLAWSPAEQSNRSTLTMESTSHPLAAGLSGDAVVQSLNPMGVGHPVADAVVIGRVPGSTTASLYGVEAGDALTSGTAPARRVSFFSSYASQSRLTANGWALFDAAITWLTPTSGPDPDPDPDPSTGAWAKPDHRYRVPFTVGAAGTPRTDRPAVVPVDFGAALAQAGQSGAFGADTLRVVEVDADGAVLDGAVPFQLDLDAGDPDTGELVILLEGTTPAGAARRYQVYFDVATSPVGPVSVVPRVSTATGVVDEGQPSVRVVTQNASWYLHVAGGGFSSIVDGNGMDWLGYNTTAGSAGTFRGTPNVVHPAGHFHPGATTSDTEVVRAGPLRARIVSTTTDGLWQIRYDLYPTFTTMTILRAADAYWFLYEGTPGGQIDPTSDVVLRSTGVQTPLSEEWVGDLAGEEWVAFADTVRNRSLFAAHHQQDGSTDSYRLMEGNMTVFGFGRSGLEKSLRGSHSMTVGLLDAETHVSIAPRVQDALRPPSATVGGVQSRPA